MSDLRRTSTRAGAPSPSEWSENSSPSEERTQRRRLWRRRVLWGLAAVLVIVRLVTLDGWLRPVRVASSSMAPFLLNRHYALRCEDCFAPLTADAATHRVGSLVTCFNCGYRRNRVLPQHARPGDRVWIDTLPMWWRAPRRWEVVALRTRNGRYVTKRVLALPGETLALVDGDVWIDGKIARKSYAEFCQQRLLVHDSDYRPSFQGSPERWHAVPPRAWERWGGAWRSMEGQRGTDREAWLEYHHLSSFSDARPPRDREEEMPVYDVVGYNGDRARAPLHAVPDLVLEGELRWSADAIWMLRLRLQAVTWVARVDVSAGRVTVTENGKRLAERPWNVPVSGKRYRRVEWGMWDRRLVLLVDGRTIASCNVSIASPAGGISRPVAIGCRKGTLLVGRCRLFRDVYYFGPAGDASRWEAPSPLATLFLAGDNQPASIDSRFRRDDLGSARLLGRVIRPIGGWR